MQSVSLKTKISKFILIILIFYNIVNGFPRSFASLGAEIISIDYDNTINKGESWTLVTTVKNHDLGVFGAHLWLHIDFYDQSWNLLDVHEGSVYLLKGSTGTFTTSELAGGYSLPIGTNHLWIGLYWDEPEKDNFQDSVPWIDVNVIVPPPPAPSLSSPGNGATLSSTSVTFTWSSVSGAIAYDIEVQTSTGGTVLTPRQTSSTSYSATIGAGSYRWHVRSRNSAGTSSWSNWNTFTITQPPSTPSLSSPSNGATLSSTGVTFDWYSVSGATGYDVEIQTSGGSSVMPPTGVSSTSYSRTLGAGSYRWRVRAKNSAGTSPWSNWNTFTVSPPPDPNIVNVAYFSEVNYGEWVTITVDAKNNGGTADWMSIALSFPDLTETSNIEIDDASAFDLGAHSYGIGEVTGYGYGAGERPLQEYPLVEASEIDWGGGLSKKFVLRVKPEKSQTFRFYVKSIANHEGRYDHHDPSSGSTDQQNEYVEVYTIYVRKKAFSVDHSSFKVTPSLTRIYWCSLEFDNDLDEDVIVEFTSKTNTGDVLSVCSYTAKAGTEGTADASQYPDYWEERNLYFSWKAFLVSDLQRTNPIDESTSDEVIIFTHTIGSGSLTSTILYSDPISEEWEKWDSSSMAYTYGVQVNPSQENRLDVVFGKQELDPLHQISESRIVTVFVFDPLQIKSFNYVANKGEISLLEQESDVINSVHCNFYVFEVICDRSLFYSTWESYMEFVFDNPSNGAASILIVRSQDPLSDTVKKLLQDLFTSIVLSPLTGGYSWYSFVQDINMFLLHESVISLTDLTKNIIFLDTQTGVPSPRIVSTTPSASEVTLGEKVTITVEATNDGGMADWQSIAISFPDISDASRIEIVDSSDFDLGGCCYVVGDEVGYGYGSGNRPLEEYPMVEASSSYWDREITKSFSVSVQPENAGAFTFYVKSVASVNEDYSYHDPVTNGGNVQDQQNEWAYEKTINVIQEILCKDITTDRLEYGPNDAVLFQFNVVNSGESSVVLDSYLKLRHPLKETLGTASLKKIELAAGEEKLIEVEYGPPSGWGYEWPKGEVEWGLVLCEIEKQLTYKDEWIDVFSVRDLDEILCLPPYEIVWNSASYNEDGAIKNVECTVEADPNGNAYAKTFVDTAAWGGGYSLALFTYGDRWVAPASGEYEIHWRVKLSGNSKLVCYAPFYGHAATRNEVWIILSVKDVDSGVSILEPRKIPILSIADPESIERDILGSLAVDLTEASLETFAEIPYLGEAVKAIQLTSALSKIAYPMNDEIRGPQDICERIILAGGREYQWSISIYTSSVSACLGMAGAWSLSNVNAEVSNVGIRPVSGDITPPETTLIEMPTGEISSRDVVFKWIGEDAVTKSSEITYEYMLVGYDSEWIQTSETSATYHNLPDESYIFKVKAKDAAGNEDVTPATTYFNIDTRGTIFVVTNCDEATWTISGPIGYSGGGKFHYQEDTPPGDYTISYNPVIGHLTPFSETKALLSGEEIVFEGDYIKADHELNIQVTGAGTTNPPPNIYTHDEGASVSVEAIADSGWSLDHWELDSVSIGSSVHITVTMDADHSLVAVFTETPIVQRHLSISISGSGSTTVGAGQHTYADGTVVSIGASPISGWMFDHWVLDGVDAGSDNPLSLTMGSDHTLTAVFTETPSWWNQQWIYRQELLITEQSGQSLTQYPIVLTLDTASLIQAGKLRPDCSDLRIIDQESQQEIPYAIRDIDSENTQIVFKIPELGPHESNTDLYLYYGNQDAQYAPENWNDIYFSFYDDFDEPIDWTRWTSETYVDTRTNRGYSISQTDSELTVSSDHTKYFGFYELYTIPIPVGDNIEVAFTLRQNTQNSEYVHTYAFLTDENSLFSGADIPETANGQRNYYEFFYQGQIAGIAFEDSPSPGAFLSVNDESITSELPNTANLLITSDRENTHQYRIHVTPSEAKCYLDDEYQLTCTENIPQYSATARILLVFGHHGAPLSSQVVDIDTIWVRSYVEPEPTIELGQETENTEQQLTADPGGPYASTEGEQVQLDASGSNSPDGEIVKYEWDLENDGEYDIQTQSSTATHAWKDDFDGTIKLRVTDSNLKQAEATTTVQIRNTAPTVEAGQDKTVETDESVSFTGSFTDPGDDTHTIIWAFGDGDTSSTLTTSHVYDSPGQYTATLTVTDDNGGEAIDILNVKVLTLTTLKLDLLPSCTFGSPLEIDGELCTPSQLIQDAQILIEYSVTGGNTWNDITMIPTDHEGKCHATWLPQATGSYIIRAKYGGEPSRYLRETSRQTSLAVTPGEANSVFSVVSNSIITNLAFDSARETLSFTISGDAGTNSHTQIVIAKTLIPDITDLKIHVDGDEVDYTYTSDESRWTLTFEYPHSSHSVVLSIQPTINQPPVAQTQQNIEGTQNSPLTFSASGSYDPDGSIAEYTWDFGDGKTGNGVTPTHTYTAEGEYMATLTITDDQGATGTTTCNVIINAPTSPPPSGGSGFIGGGGGLVLPPPDETPTVEDIQNLPPDEAADKLEEMDPEDALRIILQLDPDKKIEILNKVETDTIIEILAIMNNTEASEMLTGLQPEKSSEALSQVGFERAGEILNEMDVTDSAHVILELDMESGPKIIAEMAHDDLTEAARRVEEAVKEKIKDAPRETQREVLKKLAETLEHVDVDSLVDLFVEIAQLPETPETVATIFEAIDITKLNTIVDAWIVKEYYDELSTVMSYLTNDTLQAIYCNLSMATRGTLHPYLDEATIKALPREQLPLPDPEIIDVSINKENYHEYTIETTIQNNGNKESGELKLDYTINGKLVKRVTFASLEQQEQDTNATTWMPGKEGEYSILISLTSASDELYSDNNQYHTTRQVRFPDLQIEIILVPEEVVKNEECCIEVKVSNTSPEDIAEAFKVALLVQNQVITDEVAGLKANEEKTSSLRYTPTQIGQTSVRAEIDYNDSILESDETNNVNQTTLEVKRYSKQTVYLAGMIAASIIVLLIVGILIRRK